MSTPRRFAPLHAPAARLLPFIGRDQLLFFEPDTGPGTGGQGQSPAPQADPAEGLRNLLQRNNNDAMALAGQLYSENYQHRERIRQLSGQIPAEGSVVLSKEQAAQWAAYQELGAVDALKQSLTGAQTATAELASLKRQGVISAAAEAAGYKAAVLGQLPGASELEFVVREVEANGKKSAQAFVKGKDGTETALTAYAQQHWADFLPALQKAPASPAGTAFPGQQPSGQQQPTDAVAAAAQRFQQQRDAAPSPLKPKA